jgi:hypothetical protein
VAAGVIGCIAGFAGSVVMTAISKNSENFDNAAAATGCITGAAVAIKIPLQKVGQIVGGGIRSLLAGDAIGAVGGTGLAAAGTQEGIQLTAVTRAVTQAADGAVAVA